MPARRKTVQQADADVYTAIAHPVRRQILEVLQQGEKSANELAAPFDISRSAVSQHLGILTDAGLVMRHKQGRERIYRLHADSLSEVQHWLQQFERMWPEKLDALENMLDELKDEEDGE